MSGGHSLAVASVRAATCNVALVHTEVLLQAALQTDRVERSESRHLCWAKTGVKECDKTSDVGRVEDNHNVLNIRAVSLDVLTEVLSDTGVASEKVLTGHALLTWSTT